ncbi:MAG: hypothetical protein V4564_18655 [Pseudomonadota bacterium]
MTGAIRQAPAIEFDAGGCATPPDIPDPLRENMIEAHPDDAAAPGMSTLRYVTG